jgi:CheY-like chemotaxis protein
MEKYGEDMKTIYEGTTFLLVEDDPNDVFLVEREFKQAPRHIQLRVVYDGGEAMQYLDGDGDCGDRERCPIPNVILLDLKMPRVNGFRFLEWLRSESPGELRVIPVVVMSGMGCPDDINRAYSLGANSFIIKPVDWRHFRKLIADLGIYWAEDVETPKVEG